MYQMNVLSDELPAPPVMPQLAEPTPAVGTSLSPRPRSKLEPVELTGEQLSTAENTGNHATEVEGSGSRRGLTLQHGVDDGGEGEQQQQQQQQQQGEEGEGEEEGEEEWPQSVYEAMTMLSPKQHYQHTVSEGQDPMGPYC